MGFQKAVKTKCKARVAIYGPSGSGKTYSALRIAKGMGGRIGLIDSERLSASKYADRFEFDTLELLDKSIDGYCVALTDAKAAGISVLIIDSLSHGWQELLQEVEKLANAKYKGNTWSAWSEGTPKQRKLVDAILDFPGHVIATMRSKTEWTQQEGQGGKSRPVRVGLAPEQGKGIEYEFDILVALTTDHVAHIEKDRSGKFQDKIIEKPGEEFGKELAAWLSDGAAAAPKVEPPKPDPFTTALKAASDLPAIQKVFARIDKTQKEVHELRPMYREAFLHLYQTLTTADAFTWADTKREALKQTTVLDDATYAEIKALGEKHLQAV